MQRHRRNLYELRRELVGDSVTRERALKELIVLIREDERRKTLDTLAVTRERADR